MAAVNDNERDPHGDIETNFRRDVRQVLNMSPMDHDDRIVEEVRRLKRFWDEAGERLTAVEKKVAALDQEARES
jgi:hypothetical protein